MLYFAYGSNLNISHMAARCPAAEPLGAIKLPDSRLVFRGVADCIAAPGETCPGAVWRISRNCLNALDRYEGYRPGRGGLYRREYVPITEFEGETELMLYVMNSSGVMPPSESYLETIVQGYRDFRLPIRYLKKAVARAKDNKAPSALERARRARAGYPPFGSL